MSYSVSISQAISIVLYIAVKMKESKYEFLTTKAISEKLNIALPTAVKILNSLTIAGLTITREGAKGGVLLAKASDDITLLDIFVAIEHERALFKTKFDFNIEGDNVTLLKNKVATCLEDAENEMKNSLKKIKISDLLK
ncbi:Rrf2 family transcriptional regulator [Clostridium sp.]|uniref:RrF2 family transcriptional regulator n=1 Tax=Clostridium sp. TaxID=1506 RepID=UPI00261E9717|nr:Rrf2 family transcriptional regulator [Clostridium sp.]